MSLGPAYHIRLQNRTTNVAAYVHVKFVGDQSLHGSVTSSGTFDKIVIHDLNIAIPTITLTSADEFIFCIPVQTATRLKMEGY